MVILVPLSRNEKLMNYYSFFVTVLQLQISVFKRSLKGTCLN